MQQQKKTKYYRLLGKFDLSINCSDSIRVVHNELVIYDESQSV